MKKTKFVPLYAVLVAVAVSTLAGCGGGGGGGGGASETPTTPPPVVTSPPVVVPPLPPTPPVVVPPLPPVPPVLICTAPQVADSTGTKCETPAPVVLHYTDKVYALWTYQLPFVVTKTGVTKVVNKTSFPVLQGNVYSLNGCSLASKPLAYGWILIKCWDGATATPDHMFYIDPSKDEMYDYVDAVPADIVWHQKASIDPATPTWVAKTKVADGWYFTSDSFVLKFQADATGAVTVIKEGTFATDGNLIRLETFSN